MGDPIQEYLSEDYAYFSKEEWNETPREREARKAAFAAPTVPKGSCPKCMKHIGRGVHFHAKACNG